MIGYSKLRLVNKSRSVDFSDLTTTKTFPHDQAQTIREDISFPSTVTETDKQGTNKINHHDHDDDQCHPKQQEQQDGEGDGDEDEDQAAACSKKSSTDTVGAKYLSKNHSVSLATSAHMFKLERQRSTAATTAATTAAKSGLIQFSAVKRAFSMRRSSASAVSHEKYCRIHDQCVAVLLDDDDIDKDIFEAAEDNSTDIASVQETVRSMEEKKKRGSKGRFLKTCKRILGF